MAEDWVVGRKEIIKYFKKPLALSEDYRTAWNKIMRWREKYGMDELFHYFPSGRVYVVKEQVELWLKGLAERVK